MEKAGHIDVELNTLSVHRAAHWVEDMNLSKSAISMAQKRGRLSPTLAGNLAIKLGENPEHWIAIAALEAEPDSTLLEQLKVSANKWRKR